MRNIKTYKKYNEDIEQTVSSMEQTTKVYQKYKGRVNSLIKSEDLTKSQEDFDKFLDSLSDDEKSATDMLRIYYSSEVMKISIDKLKEDKKKIEDQIKNRIKELQDTQSKLN